MALRVSQKKHKILLKILEQLGNIDAGDEFLSEYSEEQNALHHEFLQTIGKEPDRSVVFLFNNFPAEIDPTSPARYGDMPINRKWGYLFGVTGQLNVH